MARKKILVINLTYAAYRAWQEIQQEIDCQWKRLKAEHRGTDMMHKGFFLGDFPTAGQISAMAEKGILKICYEDSLNRAIHGIVSESLGIDPRYDEGKPEQIEKDREIRKSMKPLKARRVTQEIPRRNGKGSVKVSYAFGLGPFPVPTEESSVELCGEFATAGKCSDGAVDPCPAEADAEGCRMPALCFDSTPSRQPNWYGCRVGDLYGWNGMLDLRPMYLADAGEGSDDGTVEIAGAVLVAGRIFEADEGNGEPEHDERLYAFTRFGPLPPPEPGMFEIKGCGRPAASRFDVIDAAADLLKSMIAESAEGAWSAAEDGLLEDQMEVWREHKAANPEDRPDDDPPCF